MKLFLRESGNTDSGKRIKKGAMTDEAELTVLEFSTMCVD